ncbi:MAG: MBOAT family protein [Clostridia bacterium]|nr:MBOAT family protein [Clostridia bacterium]
MLFNSYQFLLFFPIVTIIYFLLPRKVRWMWLLVMSYYFYMNWHAEYALLMASSTLVTWVCGNFVSRVRDEGKRKAALAIGIVINLGMLGYFKYTGFFLDLVQRACNLLHIAWTAPRVSILLPVGISFFVFQALGYMIDVYRRDVEPERNLFKYALFVSFFPQLVAGPIERSKNLLHQVSEPHDFDAKRVREGLLIMMLGFFEKVVIADRACIYVDAIFGNWIAASGRQIALSTIVFSIQDLGDFGGYSHIAIGAARVLGMHLMTNFRQPYFANSVRDFWSRWHVSLGTWFRDYLYFPLGGSRKGKRRKELNTMIVYTVSGLWHGAALKYVAWGMLNGALQVIEGWFPKPKIRHPRLHHIWDVARTDFLIAITMLIFRAGSMSAAVGMLWRIVTAWNAPNYATGFSYWQAVCVTICIVVLFVFEVLHEKKITMTQLTDRLPWAVRGALYIAAILAIVVFGVWGPGYNAQAFIYFQF